MPLSVNQSCGWNPLVSIFDIGRWFGIVLHCCSSANKVSWLNPKVIKIYNEEIREFAGIIVTDEISYPEIRSTTKLWSRQVLFVFPPNELKPPPRVKSCCTEATWLGRITFAQMYKYLQLSWDRQIVNSEHNANKQSVCCCVSHEKEWWFCFELTSHTTRVWAPQQTVQAWNVKLFDVSSTSVAT